MRLKVRSKNWGPRVLSKCNKRSSKPKCECLLCLELSSEGRRGQPDQQEQQRRVTMTGGPEPRLAGLGCNFILRPALPFVGRAPSREWQEEAASEAESEPEPRHKTVVYFGDTARRRRSAVNDNEPSGLEDEVVQGHPEDRPPGIVVSVSPCREDVLRIEQDQTKQEEYWSLPGDTTGFKADWSFVQQWRLRGPGGGSRDFYCPAYSTKDGSNGSPRSNAVHMVAERDTDSVASTPTPSTPIAYHHPHQSQHHHISLHELKALQRSSECAGGNSSSDENRSSGHASMSDTGGHTSSSSPAHRHQRAHSPRGNGLNSVPEDERFSAAVNQQQQQQQLGSAAQQSQAVRARPAQSRVRHRATPANKLQLQTGSGSGLEDIKLAIQQLTLRSHTSTSTYSSLSGGSESSEAPGGSGAAGGAGQAASSLAVRRLMRHSSLETVNTSATSAADEFVWVDSHSRLVELGQLPWTQHDVLRLLQAGRTRERLGQVSMELIPRLSYLLQRALVRLAREVQRLARPLGLCGQREVYSALRIVLCPALADSCTKACLRTAAMYGLPASAAAGLLEQQQQLRQSKSARAGLQLPVGRFLRWMVDVRLGRMVHEYAAVYLAAALENLLEELLLRCLPAEHIQLSATMLEHAIANDPDLWGLLQPYAHLNAGRIASGALAMPRWASASSLGSSLTSSRSCPSNSRDVQVSSNALETSLLTTCVGSMQELEELLAKLSQAGRCSLPLSSQALNALFYYMRCSQLEHGERGSGIQELAYERAYVVLPPLVEWLRVASAHAEHRHARLIDHDDVAQAARILLPGVDCPVRTICSDEAVIGSRTRLDDSGDYVRRLSLEMAFKLLTSGRAELIRQALTLLPEPKINTVNENGLTALMLCCVRGDEAGVLGLLEAGAEPNVETPPASAPSPIKPAQHGPTNAPLQNTPVGLQNGSSSNGQAQLGPLAAFYAETQHWTALTYTALLGHCNIARMLLERGAAVEGGARLSEDKCTITPLQAATASGNNEMVALLLAHGAQPFLSTLMKDSFCYSGSAQRGCYSAISVATAHGQRSCLQQLLAHPLNFSTRRGEKEVLSLEEILAEGQSSGTAQQNISTAVVDDRGKSQRDGSEPVQFSKAQYKALQEAMYHSAESNHLDITMELRGLRVPWTLHCWMHSLSTAHELRIDSVIDQLLQDFLQVCPDDYSAQFVQECLPLLFNIFRYSKKEGTTLLLADIFCTCYGWEPIRPIRDSILSNGSRIDPKFVNNPELSDVQFRVEGRVFYGHKIVLVTSSPRFRNMLSSKLCEGNPPIVQINDIRYHIFQFVMEFLYNGGCSTLQVDQSDVLELMAAANFFQLDGLLRFCEAQCSTTVNLDNVVSMYIHAKVYNAMQLLEYCQGFLLQNMVALLTYDDSIKRLLFAKKLPNHDVLAGLLLTLQARIKARKPQNPK